MADEEEGCCSICCNALLVYWRTIVLILAPIVFLPIIFSKNDPAHRCLYIVAIMAVYWITEALPLAMTSLMPMVFFPLMGISASKDVSMQYMAETNMMFIGGIIIALAVEHCNLHRRVSLKVIMCIGCSTKRLNMGLMLVTMCVSMWISNTASTAMMAPIIEATLSELQKQNLGRMLLDEEIMTAEGEMVKKPSKTTVGFFLSIAFTASIGGTGTLVGTGTNMVMKGVLDQKFEGSPGVSFAKWMAYAVPIMIVTQIMVGIWIQIYYLGLFRPNSETARNQAQGDEAVAIAEKMIKESYDELGPLRFHEVAVGISFILAVLLWFFKSPKFIKGWAEMITNTKVKNGTTAMFVCLILFMVPAQITFHKIFRKNRDERPKVPSPALLTWKVVQQKMPWGLVFLLGGGFAVAEGSGKSGMSVLLASKLKVLTDLGKFPALCLTCLFASFLTDFSANVAIANIILPVLAEMSRQAKWHPFYLMVPATLACSHSFSLPVSTPPNAIVQAPCNIPTSEYLKSGVMSSVLALIVLLCLCPTMGRLLFNLDVYPEWAEHPVTKPPKPLLVFGNSTMHTVELPFIIP